MQSTIKNAVIFAGLLSFANLTIAADFDNTIAGISEQEYEKIEAMFVDFGQEGDPAAQFKLAKSYLNGANGVIDVEQAMVLVHLAAENDLKEAQQYLSVAYATGLYDLPMSRTLSKMWDARSETDYSE